MTDKSLDGVRVLVVEDEAMVTMLIEDILADLGCTVVGIAARIEEAISMATSLGFDVAILDVNLEGFRTEPVAEVLAERGIPFAFATGYGPGGVPDAFRGAPILSKPFDEVQLQRTLTAALAG